MTNWGSVSASLLRFAMHGPACCGAAERHPLDFGIGGHDCSAEAYRPPKIAIRSNCCEAFIFKFAAPDGSPWVMLPRGDYDLLHVEIETLRKAVQEMSAAQISAEDQPIPHDVLDAIARGASPIKAWRKYRRMTQAALASAVGVTPAAVHYIETGVSYGRRQTRRAIADALDASPWAIDPARFLYLHAKSTDLGSCSTS